MPCLCRHKEVQNETSPVPRYRRREHCPHGTAIAFFLFVTKEYSKDTRKGDVANHHNSNAELLPCKQCEIQSICGAEPSLRPSEDPPATTIQSCGSLPVFCPLPAHQVHFVLTWTARGRRSSSETHLLHLSMTEQRRILSPARHCDPAYAEISSHFSASSPIEKEWPQGTLFAMQCSTISVPAPLSTHKHGQNREMQKAKLIHAIMILLQPAGGGYHILDKSHHAYLWGITCNNLCILLFLIFSWYFVRLNKHTHMFRILPRVHLSLDERILTSKWLQMG